MNVQKIPNSFLPTPLKKGDFFVYDYRMTIDVVKSKVELGYHMFSFLQIGQKEIHLGENSALVNENQSLLIKKGNCLVTELLNKDQIYFCKLFFFSEKNVLNFIEKNSSIFEGMQRDSSKDIPLFKIDNDTYIKYFVDSLSCILNSKIEGDQKFLSIKFEEIMMYLLHKYGYSFIQYIYSHLSKKRGSSFQEIIESKAESNLKLNEIAFLCNMSLSTFKRHFIEEYKVTPGKWLKHKRLHKAKALFEKGEFRPAEIYRELGYSSLSNFSVAFKNEFGYSPNQAVKPKT